MMYVIERFLTQLIKKQIAAPKLMIMTFSGNVPSTSMISSTSEDATRTVVIAAT